MWIVNAHIPHSVIRRHGGSPLPVSDSTVASSPEFLPVHLQIEDGENSGKYTYVYTAHSDFPENLFPNQSVQGLVHESVNELVIDQRGGILLPCFVDIHTHLDKGHIWPRTPNPDGTFAAALTAVPQDAQHYWTEEDLYRRMSFGLECSYAHGTQAVRTHLDSSGALGLRTWRVFRSLRREWQGRIELQGVALVPPAYYFAPEAEALWETIAENHGILGGVFTSTPQLEQSLDRLFQLAQSWQFPLDLHVDESNDRHDRSLLAIAQAKLRHDFYLSVVCGHCCSLSLQSPEDLAETIATVKTAQIGIVSLPLCNLYLQDRHPHRTPRWRGITAIHELRTAGVPLALASDNCRDPFYAFGDHDGLEVFRESVRIGHLDHPYGTWIEAVTTTPGAWMGLAPQPPIQIGAPADFILFKARTWNELLSRPQSDRRIFRNGQEVAVSLPDYEQLDSIVGYPNP